MTDIPGKPLAASVTIVALAALLMAGCGGAIVREEPKPTTVSLSDMKAMSRLVEGERTAKAQAGEFLAGRLWVIQTIEDLPATTDERQDRVFVVLEGAGVAIVGGVRTPVVAGDAAIVPRRTDFSFQIRGDTPVTLLCVTARSK